MKKKTVLSIGVLLLMNVMLTGCCLKHDWQEATCTEPKICSVCEKTKGEPLGHTWEEATCTEPKTCTVCGKTKGEALGHTWTEATCTVPKTCSVCNETAGKALGHMWTEATCTEPKTCSVCRETEGEAVGHDWMDATCTSPKACIRCKAMEGKALEHDLNTVDICNRCGECMGVGIAFTFEDGVLTVFGKGELTKETWRAALEKYGDDSDEKYPYFDACNTMVITGNITGISRDVFDKDTYYTYYSRTDFLEKLVIEDSVTGEIGWSAFGSRYKLTDVYIGDGIHTISIGAFDSDWMKMTSFSVSRNCTLEVSYQTDGYGSLTGVMNDIFGSGSISVIADRCDEIVTRRR